MARFSSEHTSERSLWFNFWNFIIFHSTHAYHKTRVTTLPSPLSNKPGPDVPARNAVIWNSSVFLVPKCLINIEKTIYGPFKVKETRALVKLKALHALFPCQFWRCFTNLSRGNWLVVWDNWFVSFLLCTRRPHLADLFSRLPEERLLETLRGRKIGTEDPLCSPNYVAKSADSVFKTLKYKWIQSKKDEQLTNENSWKPIE